MHLINLIIHVVPCYVIKRDISSFLVVKQPYPALISGHLNHFPNRLLLVTSMFYQSFFRQLQNSFPIYLVSRDHQNRSVYCLWSLLEHKGLARYQLMNSLYCTILCWSWFERRISSLISVGCLVTPSYMYFGVSLIVCSTSKYSLKLKNDWLLTFSLKTFIAKTT